MIPNIPLLEREIAKANYPNKTHKIVFKESDFKNGVLALSMTVEDGDYDRINGYTDDLQAVAQAIYLILSTERYKFIIYSWDYGVELVDLFGKPIPYVMAELPRRIKEALIQDNRIDDVINFEFEKNGKRLYTTFTVVSNVGKISTALEVEI